MCPLPEETQNKSTVYALIGVSMTSSTYTVRSRRPARSQKMQQRKVTMARTRDYMEYLDEKIGIAPANSQEELQASEIIADLMGQHGLETSVQEFDSHGSGTLVRDVFAIVLFVSLLVGGILEGAPRILLMLLALASAGILVFMYFVRNPFEDVGPTHRSQNVIGVRPATNPDAVRGSRPIVIVAHYDTPREAVLRRMGLQRYEAMLVRVGSFCPVVVAVAVVSVVVAVVAEARFK